MNDAAGVGGIQSVGDLDGEAEQSFGFERPSRDEVSQCHPVKELHHDQRPAILLADIVDGAYVGVIQCRSGLGFSLKTGEHMGIVGNVFGQEFKSNETMQARVLGLVDHTHPTAA